MIFFKFFLIIIFFLTTSCSAISQKNGQPKSDNNEIKIVERYNPISFNSEVGTTEHLSLEVTGVEAGSSIIKVDYKIENISGKDVWVCTQSNTVAGNKSNRLNYEVDIFKDRIEISLKQPYITDFLESPIYTKFKRIPANRASRFQLEVILPIVKLTTETGFYASDDKEVIKSNREIKKISFSVGYYLNNMKMIYCATYGEKYCGGKLVNETEMEIIHLWRKNNSQLAVSTNIILTTSNSLVSE